MVANTPLQRSSTMQVCPTACPIKRIVGPRLPGHIKVVTTNIAQRAVNRSAAVHNSPLQNSGALFSDLRAAAQWCPTARCKEHVSCCSASGSFDSGTRYQIGMPDTVEWLCT